jgi:two-component system sensor histidine kinase TctE
MSPMTDALSASQPRPRRAASLTLRLAVAIALILAAGGVAVTVAALAYGRQAAQEAYDRLLIGAANQIAASVAIRDGQIVVDIPVPAFELLALAPEDRVIYRVVGQDGETITGYDSVPPPPEGEGEVIFYHTRFGDEPVRLASVRRRFAERAFSGSVDVIVGQTTRARAALARDIARSALVVLGVAGLCMAALAAFAIHSALRPLRRIERDLLARDPSDLTPLGVAVPREIETIVTAIDRFMVRLDRQIGIMKRLIADTSHQLRTPVAALRAQAELAAGESDPERQRRIVARIHGRSIGLSRLTDQLLSHALIIHRADAVPRERVDLRAAAIRAVDEIDHGPAADEPALRLDLAEEPVWVQGDTLSLAEACKNLINNARSHGKPPVTVQVVADGRTAEIRVRDRGPGMPEEQWRDAATRFSRNAGVAPDRAGLGLAIAQAVAAAHSGRLTFGRAASGEFEVALVLALGPAQDRAGAGPEGGQ